MSILTRPDGIQFVTQVYREIVRGKKSLIAQRVKLLAEQHGRFVRLFKKDNTLYEVSFSNTPGYLLGETIKHYFAKIQNLIFCESLHNKEILLVIIREGSVYIDNVMSEKTVFQELIPLLSDPRRYDIIVSGNVPIKKNSDEDKVFVPPSELIKSFKVLKDPLFPILPTNRMFQLLPLPLALKEERLQFQSLNPLILITVICLIFGTILIIYSNKTHTPETIQPETDHYRSYQQALMTAAPETELTELNRIIEVFYTLSGWRISSINFQNQAYEIYLTSSGGNLKELIDWARQKSYFFQLTTNAALLKISSHSALRSKPRNIYFVQNVLSYLIDQFDSILIGKKIHIDNFLQHDKITEVQLSLELENLSPSILPLIGKILTDLPITITKIGLNLTSGGINGTIQFSVWGE